MSQSETRSERAARKDVTMIQTDANDTVIKADGGGAHMIETDGSDAVSCSCPDWEHREPDGGCYHMIAYGEWEIDRVIVGGSKVEL